MSAASVNIRVVVRLRPKNKNEEKLEKAAKAKPATPEGKYKFALNFHEDGKGINISTTKLAPNDYVYDRVFAPGSTQEEVYEDCAKPVIEDILRGYNGTIFAYGQTGSGKTHTMFGPRPLKEDTCGIVPRATSHIFDHINSDTQGSEYTLQCSYVEIYREVIQDLLDPSKSNLAVRETPTRGIYIEGVTAEFVSSEGDIMDLLAIGDSSRRVASTNMNEQSSRSHSLFMITVQQKDAEGSVRTGRLNLVDLAGSEKIEKTGAKGTTLEEAKKINQSLSALGNCIKALTDSKRTHVPYRDSKLTRILQDSLGGNTKTTLMVAASPAEYNADETISSLKFAKRAKTIKTTVRVNKVQSAEELQALVASLRKELQSLKRYCAKLEKMIPADKRPRRGTTVGGPLPQVEEEALAEEPAADEEDEEDDDGYDPLEIAELRREMEKLKEEYRIEMEDLQQTVIVLGESEAEAQAELELVRVEKEKLEMQQKKARNRSSTVERQTAATLKMTEFELANKQEELQHALDENQRLSDRKLVMETEMASLEESITQLQDAEANFKAAEAKHQQELATANKQVTDLQAEVASETEAKAKLQSKVDEVEGQLEVAHKERDVAQTTVSELRQEVQTAKLAHVDLEAEVEKKTHEVSMLEQEVSAQKAKVERAQEEAKASVQAVAGESSDLLAAEQARTKQTQEELEKANAEKGELENKVTDAEAEKKKITVERDTLQQELDSVKGDLASTQSELETARTERDTAKSDAASAIAKEKAEKEAAASAAGTEAADLRENLTTAQDELASVKKELSTAQSNERKATQEVSELSSALEAEKSRGKDTIQKHQTRLVEAESLLAQAQSDRETIQGDVDRLENELAAAKSSHADQVKDLQATILELQEQVKKLSTRGTVRKPVRLRGGQESSSVLDAYRAKIDLKEHISGLRQVDSKAAQEIAALRAAQKEEQG